MDSLLYVGAADDDDDDDDDDDGESQEEHEEEADEAKPAAPAVDYEALQRAGLKATSDLRQTETYQKLTAAEEEEREAKKLAREREAEAKAEAVAAQEAAKSELLNRKKMDEKLGWEKRYDRTKEDFRAKEKRKRDAGQQSRDSSWVEEEKRRLRHGSTGNYDS